MDQKLLKALEDIGYGLEALVEALESKEEAKSDSGKAIQSGDFGKQLESISNQLVSIKADTQEILKQQKTLLGISKEKEKEKGKDTKEIEGAGDAKKEKRLKSGIGTILLIAVAVLAIGMAFKLVGKIDFLSVIALGLAIYVVAQAFAKVAEMKLTLKEAFITSLTMVLMSVAITASSYILQGIVPISIIQLMTAVAIAGVFATIGMSLEKLGIGITIFHKMLGNKVTWVVPLVMVAIATAITASSWIMSGITPIGITQALTAIAIAGVFAIIGFSLQKIATGIVIAHEVLGKSATWKMPLILVAIATAITMSSWIMQLIVPIGFAQVLTAIVISFVFWMIGYALPHIAFAVFLVDKAMNAKKAAWIMPLILVAIATAITMSSWIFSLVVPMGWKEALTIILITIVFAILGFALPFIALGVVMVDKILGAKKLFVLPLVFVFTALAIMLSSHIFAEMADIEIGKMFKILLYGVIMAIVVTAFLPAVVISAIAAKLVGIGNLLVGVVAIVAVAAAIMASSLILEIGSYESYPGLGWVIGVGLALTVFSVAAAALGLLVFGPQALIFLAGLAAVLGVAATIVGVSHILKDGEYNLPGFLSWALGTALLYAAFTPILITLGAVGLASSVISFFGPNPWEMAKEMMLQIAETIVAVSYVLAEGSYKKGPTKEWAEGIAIALGAFAPVYKMLVDNAFWSVFGMGGIGPDEFADGILTVTAGIVVAANEFANNDAVFKNGPPVEWATGVGKAISAFSPVYGVLLGQGRSYFDKIFGGPGPTVEDMRKAIITISQGIVEAAKFFAENTSPFTEGNYPSKRWGEGVGGAISAFAPVFTAISATPWYSSPGETIAALASGISAVSSAIVEAGWIFAGTEAEMWKADKVPNKAWGEGVAASIKAFGYVFDYMAEESGWFTSGEEVISDMCNAVTSIADAIAYSGQQFTYVSDWKKYPTSDWANNVSDVSKTMTYLSKFLIDQYGESDYDIAWGLYTMSLKIKETAQHLSGSNSWKAPKPMWAIDAGFAIREMAYTDYQIWRGIKDTYPLGDSVLRMAKNMSKAAKYLFSASDAFEYKVPDDFIPSLRKTMFDFQELVFEMVEREEDNKGFADKFLARIGIGDAKSKDPILVMANRLVKLAKGYDALANSLTKLGGAMKSLNVKSSQELGNLTAGLLKGKAPGAVSVNNNMTQNRVQMAEMKRVKKEEQKKKEDEAKKPSELQKDIKQIIKLLKNIDKSVSSVDEYIAEVSGIQSSGAGGGLFK